MTNPIEAAVAPLKADALSRANMNAREMVAKYAAALAEMGGARYPYPSSRGHNRESYARALAQYNVMNSLTTPLKASHRVGEPVLCEIDPTKVERFVQNAMDAAGLAYDAFVAKLVSKVGEVESAELTGNHVWGYSVLKVAKAGGVVESWKTQQIVNVSKLGLLFNQWPTRKMK